MDEVVQRVLNFPAIWTYLVVALLVIAEEAMVFGLLVPGDTAAILAGVAASRGHLSIATTLALVIASALVGASIGYWIGRVYGTRVLEWKIFDRYRDNLTKAGDFLQRHGGWAILVGRFSTFFRTMLPELVGMSPMPFRRFVVASAVGAIIWGSVLVLCGYLIGESFTAILKRVDNDLLIIVPILAVLALVYWKWHRHRNAAED